MLNKINLTPQVNFKSSSIQNKQQPCLNNNTDQVCFTSKKPKHRCSTYEDSFAKYDKEPARYDNEIVTYDDSPVNLKKGHPTYEDDFAEYDDR